MGRKGFFILMTSFFVFLCTLLSIIPLVMIKPKFSVVKKLDEDIYLMKKAKDKCIAGAVNTEIANRKIVIERVGQIENQKETEDRIGNEKRAGSRKIIFDLNCEPILIIW